MNTRRGLLAAGALALPVALAVAAPASASASSTRLGIGPTPGTSQANLLVGASQLPGQYEVVVVGHIAGPGPFYTPVTFELFGDDPLIDDDLGVSVSGIAVQGSFHISTDVPRSVLNEDRAGTDEVYAHVTAPGFSATTNVVSANF